MELETIKRLTARLPRLLEASLVYPRSERLPVRLIRDDSLQGLDEDWPPEEEAEFPLISAPEPRQLRGENIFAIDFVRVRSLDESPRPRKLKKPLLLFLDCCCTALKSWRSWKLVDLVSPEPEFPLDPLELVPSFKLFVDLWNPNFFILGGGSGLESKLLESLLAKSLAGV